MFRIVFQRICLLGFPNLNCEIHNFHSFLIHDNLSTLSNDHKDLIFLQASHLYGAPSADEITLLFK